MEKLQIGPADPVLSFTRTIYNLLSQPIELVKSVHFSFQLLNKRLRHKDKLRKKWKNSRLVLLILS
jgi:hypothetical protein